MAARRKRKRRKSRARADDDGVAVMTEFEQVLNRLPQALRDEVARHWEAFGAAARTAGVEPPAGAALAQLVTVWACSDFVARACIGEPVLLADLVASGDLAATYAPGDCSARLVHR